MLSYFYWMEILVVFPQKKNWGNYASLSSFLFWYEHPIFLHILYTICAVINSHPYTWLIVNSEWARILMIFNVSRYSSSRTYMDIVLVFHANWRWMFCELISVEAFFVMYKKRLRSLYIWRCKELWRIKKEKNLNFLWRLNEGCKGRTLK